MGIERNVERIPAISIRQPWAELIVSGRKTVELRKWSTEYRGSLWIHVGIHSAPELDRHFGFSGLFRGGYLGKVVLEAIVPMDPQRWDLWREAHLDTAEYQEGFFAFVLADQVRFDHPIAGRGNLKLFYPPEELQRTLEMSAFAPFPNHVPSVAVL